MFVIVIDVLVGLVDMFEMVVLEVVFVLVVFVLVVLELLLGDVVLDGVVESFEFVSDDVFKCCCICSLVVVGVVFCVLCICCKFVVEGD